MQIVATATEGQPLTVSSPTIQGTAELLQKSQEQFLKSDESAFSIVPSRMSSRFSLSTIQTGDRDSVRSSASLVYHPFTFENDLFTARVYKRNYRTCNYQGSRKPKADRDSETAVLPEHEQKYSNNIFRLGLRTRRGGLPFEVTLPKYAIVVTTSVTIEVEHTGEIWHRSLSAFDPYMRLVKACDRGDEISVRGQLNIISPRWLSSYVSGSIYVCPIHTAVFSGHVEVLGTLLRYAESGNDIHRVLMKTIGGTEPDCWRPLHVATMKRNLPMVLLLIEKGAFIHAETGSGIQAVHLAAKTGSIEILAALIAAGASVNCRDHKGCQPMHYLSEIQRPEVIEYLAEKGAEIDGVSDTSQITPLGFACRNGIYANARALLSLGALVTGPILDSAVKYGSTYMVETLLISAASQKQGQSIVVASLRESLSTFERKLTEVSYEDIKKLRFLLRHTDLLAKDHNGDTIFYSLFHWLSPDKRDLFGLEEAFLDNYFSYFILHYLPDFIRHYLSDYIWLPWETEKLKEAFIAGLKRDSTDASAFSDQSSQNSQGEEVFSTSRESGPTSASASSDLSSQDSQEKEAGSENRESGPTGASASLDTPLGPSPGVSTSDALLPSEHNLSIEAAISRAI